LIESELGARQEIWDDELWRRGGVMDRTMIACALLLLGYNPAASLHPPTEPVLTTVRDIERKREIPVKIYRSSVGGRQPLVLFSHGLGGSREGSSYLGTHLSSRGYTMIALQHPGSDESVWRGKPPREVMGAMRDAANGRNLLERVADVRAVLDWASQADSQPGRWQGAFDLGRVGMSGHSFGAHTTQAVGGQAFPGRGQVLTDSRVTAAIAYSPSPPSVGSPKEAFGKVSIPWLLMTGTKDDSPIGDTKPEDRLNVFPHLSGISCGQLVLDEGSHMAFTDRAPGRRDTARNPAHHKAIAAVSAAFWDAHLKGRSEAKEWLASEGVRGVLSAKDQFVYKSVP
jgi:predicted dienelactone hydrolase